VQRSNREGRPADIPSARVRFAFEAAFLILVALGAALMELRPLAIILLMACAWLLVALIERASAREAARPVDEAHEGSEAVPMEEVPAGEIAPKEAYRWLFWRRARAAAEGSPSPTAALEERPARSHVRRIEPAEETKKPQEEPVPAGVGAAETEAEPPGPAVTTRPLDLPGLEQPVAAPPASPPRARGALARAVQRVAPPPAPPSTPPPPQPREWNLWDLERRAREQAGNAPQDEEWSALFTHLRVFADVDGVLPKEFDELVRESFGQLIEAA
jgi:hypothetical protein